MDLNSYICYSVLTPFKYNRKYILDPKKNTSIIEMIGANVCCVYDSKYQLCEKSCRKQILVCVSFFYIVTSENLLTVPY